MRLAILTTGRQDWGILRPLCEALRADAGFSVEVLAGGMACSPAFGRVVDAIRALGFEVVEEMDWAPDVNDAVRQTSEAVALVGAALQRQPPDALMVLGDRYETAGAALAATVLGIPVVHLYGGEETEGAIDNALRHAITKLSHLHLVAHGAYAERVLQMGEPPSTVHVVGSLGVDNLVKLDRPTRAELEAAIGITLGRPLGLVTVHPTTLSRGGQPDEVSAVIAAIKAFPATWVITLPNADPGHAPIREALEALADGAANIATVSALGEERYLGLMRQADFVLGNSSSGITEAPSLRVPTINVGDRQRGRVRSPSVLDVACDEQEIVGAIRKALSPDWRARVDEQPLPFGDGHATERILAVLKAWVPPRPARKVFHPRRGHGELGG